MRANAALVLSAVADRAPRRADAGAERRLRNDAALPDRVDQLVLAHDPVAVANQMDQQIEYLRLDGNDVAARRNSCRPISISNLRNGNPKHPPFAGGLVDLPTLQMLLTIGGGHRRGPNIPYSGNPQEILRETRADYNAAPSISTRP